MARKPKIAIIGAGPIGGILGAHLAQEMPLGVLLVLGHGGAVEGEQHAVHRGLAAGAAQAVQALVFKIRPGVLGDEAGRVGEGVDQRHQLLQGSGVAVTPLEQEACDRLRCVIWIAHLNPRETTYISHTKVAKDSSMR